MDLFFKISDLIAAVQEKSRYQPIPNALYLMVVYITKDIDQGYLDYL